jgi:DNA-binding NtrC family response regulator
MDTETRLKGKRILVVDDEQDILDTLVDMLDMCDVDTAGTFEEARSKLESTPYDAAVLDIMGVRGYDLLEIAKQRNIPAIMLTAHALTAENLIKSAKQGADFFAPKDEINRIPIFIADVLESREKNRNAWGKWFDRLSDFCDKRFGPDWKDKDSDFWDSMIKRW